MGQYYLPSLLTKSYKKGKRPIKAQLCAHDFCGGLKLMEHSYVGTYLMQAVEYLLSTNKSNPFVWAGDYAEKLQGHNDNIFSIGDENGVDRKTLKKLPLVETKSWLGKAYMLDPKYVKTYKFAINHSKKLYVVIPIDDPIKNPYGTIHPLPLLTAESNGLGGGDYWGKASAELVGSWKYDVISVGNEIPKGYKKLVVHFKEG